MLWFFIMLFGLVLGFGVGYAAPLVPSLAYGRYLSIAILASLDTAFGGIRASLEGKYENAVFVSGFFTNMVLAAGLIYMGDRLGVKDLYLAGVVALGIRVFQNLGIIRRRLFERWRIISTQANQHASPR